MTALQIFNIEIIAFATCAYLDVRDLLRMQRVNKTLQVVAAQQLAKLVQFKPLPTIADVYTLFHSQLLYEPQQGKAAVASTTGLASAPSSSSSSSFFRPPEHLVEALQFVEFEQTVHKAYFVRNKRFFHVEFYALKYKFEQALRALTLSKIQRCNWKLVIAVSVPTPKAEALDLAGDTNNLTIPRLQREDERFKFVVVGDIGVVRLYIGWCIIYCTC